MGFAAKRATQTTEARPTPLWAGAAEYYKPLTERIQEQAGILGGMRAEAVPTEEGLYQQASNRLLQGMRPGYARRGLLTSGEAQEAETRKLGELATTFGERAFERGITRRGAEAATRKAGTEDLLRLLSLILGQPTAVSGTTKGREMGFDIRAMDIAKLGAAPYTGGATLMG